MEQQATREKSDYNQSVFAQMALYSALGTNAKFSQTNISMLFAMNMGDCRHHAQVKQLIFDRWKDRKLNNILNAMLESKDPQEQEGLEEDFNNCYLVEMRMIDSRISAPVELKKDKNGKSQMYRPQWTPDGKMQVVEDYQDLEEHTFCVLITRNKGGELTECRFADAFYRDGTYDLSYNGKNSIINLDGIKVVKRKDSCASEEEKHLENSEEYIWEFTEEAGVKLNPEEINNQNDLLTGVKFRPSPFTRSGKNRIIKMKGMVGNGLYYLGQEKIPEDQSKKFINGKIVDDAPGKYGSEKLSEESALSQRRKLFLEIKKAILKGMSTSFPVKTKDKDENEITLDINSVDDSRLSESDKSIEGFKSEQDRILYTKGDIYDYTFCVIFNSVCNEVVKMPIDQMNADEILDIITQHSQCMSKVFAKDKYQSKLQSWSKAPDYLAIMNTEEFQSEYKSELQSIAEIV